MSNHAFSVVEVRRTVLSRKLRLFSNREYLSNIMQIAISHCFLSRLLHLASGNRLIKILSDEHAIKAYDAHDRPA